MVGSSLKSCEPNRCEYVSSPSTVTRKPLRPNYLCHNAPGTAAAKARRSLVEVTVLRMVLACGLMLTGTVASAQERIALLTRSDATGLSMSELDATVSGFGALRSVTPVTRAPGDNFLGVPIAVSGARYLGWISAGRSGSDLRYIQVFDRRTHTTVLLPPGRRGPTGSSADPLRPRVFSDSALGTASTSGGVFAGRRPGDGAVAHRVR